MCMHVRTQQCEQHACAHAVLHQMACESLVGTWSVSVTVLLNALAMVVLQVHELLANKSMDLFQKVWCKQDPTF